jgi:hypothetical protein
MLSFPHNPCVVRIRFDNAISESFLAKLGEEQALASWKVNRILLSGHFEYSISVNLQKLFVRAVKFGR